MIIDIFICELKELFLNIVGADFKRACFMLMEKLNYPIKEFLELTSEPIEELLYFFGSQKHIYSSKEMHFLKNVNQVIRLFDLDFGENSDEDERISFLAIDITDSKSDRTKDIYCITKIVNRIYKSNLICIFRHIDAYSFTTYTRHNDEVILSDWFSQDSDFSVLEKLCDISCDNFTSAKDAKSFYLDFTFAITRNYIKYPKSYEFLTYESIPKNILEDDDSEEFISKRFLLDFAEEQLKSIENEYDDDFLETDFSFKTLEEENGFEIEENIDIFLYESNEKQENFDQLAMTEDINNQIYIEHDIERDIIDDPIKLLKWLEEN